MANEMAWQDLGAENFVMGIGIRQAQNAIVEVGRVGLTQGNNLRAGDLALSSCLFPTARSAVDQSQVMNDGGNAGRIVFEYKEVGESWEFGALLRRRHGIISLRVEESAETLGYEEEPTLPPESAFGHAHQKVLLHHWCNSSSRIDRHSY